MPEGDRYEAIYQERSAIGALLGDPAAARGGPVGAISIRRMEAGPFAEPQDRLLETFAAQAVIAIENVRLFQELQARNRELTEALEQQTATSEVLGVISSSPTDPQPVYRTILANVTRLCEANIAALFMFDGEVLAAAAHHGATPEFAEFLRPQPPPPEPRDADPAGRARAPDRPRRRCPGRPGVRPVGGPWVESPRTVLSVPMLREGELVGVITTWRREVGRSATSRSRWSRRSPTRR